MTKSEAKISYEKLQQEILEQENVIKELKDEAFKLFSKHKLWTPASKLKEYKDKKLESISIAYVDNEGTNDVMLIDLTSEDLQVDSTGHLYMNDSILGNMMSSSISKQDYIWKLNDLNIDMKLVGFYNLIEA